MTSCKGKKPVFTLRWRWIRLIGLLILLLAFSLTPSASIAAAGLGDGPLNVDITISKSSPDQTGQPTSLATPPRKLTTCSNNSKSTVGSRCRATSGGMTSKTENDVFHGVTIGSMMSIPRDEATDAMPNDSSSNSEPGKPTIPETTTEPLSLLTNVQSDE